MQPDFEQAFSDFLERREYDEAGTPCFPWCGRLYSRRRAAGGIRPAGSRSCAWWTEQRQASRLSTADSKSLSPEGERLSRFIRPADDDLAALHAASALSPAFSSP
jgi:hypothetical protein